MKIPELEGDDGKHRKIQTNSLLHAATGSTSSTKEEKRYVNTNMNKIFEKIGENLYLMIEKETVRLEDSLTAMVNN